MNVDINDFNIEKKCTYKGELYSVRDNGAVLRHPRDGKHLRLTDNKWTFGKQNEKTGYMEVSSERVHRIVAFAFLGEPPSKEHVVDHIDTNRCNNRPENLQWLTRLENTLKNPITVRKIEILCGSVEAFLADPTILRESDLPPNYKWMRTVNPQEAKACLHNMQSWAKSKKTPSGGSLGEWVYKPIDPKQLEVFAPEPTVLAIEKTQSAAQLDWRIHSEQVEEIVPEPPMFVLAKTKGAAQLDWRVPSEFPCCPQEAGTDPIATYAERLKKGALFTRNDIYETMVSQFALMNDRQTIFVMTQNLEEDPIKPWALAKITYENGLYIHTSLGTFFSKEGAEKQFTLAQGLEWTGEDSIDDYC